MIVRETDQVSTYSLVKRRAHRVLTKLANVFESDAEPSYPPYLLQSKRWPSSHLALVAGYFSYSNWYATFGDTEAMRVVTEWLDQANISFDVACHPSTA